MAALCGACFGKYRAFSYYDHDTAIMNQALWNSLHGRFLRSSILGGTLLKSHCNVTAILLLPIYALWQSPLWLLYIQTIVIALAGWPIYLLARREIKSPCAAVLFLILYLLYPALGYTTLHHFCMENFALFLLAWAYYFYRTARYRFFITFLFAAIATREEISFIAVAMGVTALWERRSVRWWLAPMAAGITWFAGYYYLLLPYLQNSSEAWYLTFYSQWGRSAGEIARTLLTNPSRVLASVAEPRKLTYAIQMLLPLGFLPLLAPGVLFIPSPVVMLNLLSSHPDMATILRHYNSPIIPFVFFAGIAGYARVRARIAGRVPQRLLFSAVLITGVCSSWMTGPQLHLASRTWIGAAECPPKDDFLNPFRREMVGMVPPRVPVTATFPFFTHLSDRSELESLNWLLYGRMGLSPDAYPGRSDIECALIDFGDATTFIRFYDPRKSPPRFRRFLDENGLGLVKMHDRIALFSRGARDIFPLYERAATDAHPTPLAAFEGLDLIESRLELTGEAARRQISFSSCWRAEKGLSDDLSMILRITDANGRDMVPHQVRSICHHLYPTWEWQTDETIRATHLIALPPETAPGNYVLRMAVINKFPPCRARRCEVRTGRIDTEGWYIAGEFRI
jgi:uncharacterized membrane protein